MGEVVLMRDYKTREEIEIELRRQAERILADHLDCAPSEWSPPYEAPEKDPA